MLDRYGHLLPGAENRVNEALDAMIGDATEARERSERAKTARNRVPQPVGQGPVGGNVVPLTMAYVVGAKGLEPLTSAV